MGENSVAKGKVGFFFLHVGWEKRVAQPSEIDYSAHAWLFKSNSKCMLTYFWGALWWLSLQPVQEVEFSSHSHLPQLVLIVPDNRDQGKLRQRPSTVSDSWEGATIMHSGVQGLTNLDANFWMQGCLLDFGSPSLQKHLEKRHHNMKSNELNMKAASIIHMFSAPNSTLLLNSIYPSSRSQTSVSYHHRETLWRPRLN